jgi:curved DNA-binding protein
METNAFTKTTMTFVDYYLALGILKTATPAEIKAAYRKLARKHHPDLNPNDKNAQTKFQQINEANEVLSDPVKRKKYDQYGSDWEHADDFDRQKQQQQQQQHRESYADEQTTGDFSSFFESLFGGSGSGSRNRQKRYKGQDYNSELQLSLLEASKTHTQTITVDGKNIRITIPAGIENGQTIKISGHGGLSNNGGPNGDLYLVFNITPHPAFKRMGNNLNRTVNLDLYVATLGGEITVETLNGKVKLKVAPGTQNGSKIKLSGKGFPIYKKEGVFGDFIITYAIRIPTNLTARQKALFTELSMA